MLECKARAKGISMEMWGTLITMITLKIWVKHSPSIGLAKKKRGKKNLMNQISNMWVICAVPKLGNRQPHPVWINGGKSAVN